VLVPSVVPDPRLAVTWMPLPDAAADSLTRLVADFAGIPRTDVRIVRACRSCGSDRHGKPQVVLAGGHTPLHVSLSRSGDLAVAVVTDAGPVGVDVEAAGPDVDDVTAWVHAESLVKATGHGLTIDPADIVDERWMRDLDAPDGYVAAVTVLTTREPRIVTTRAAPAG
jgi:4'-phosphopantetheinyl transferase